MDEDGMLLNLTTNDTRESKGFNNTFQEKRKTKQARYVIKKNYSSSSTNPVNKKVSQKGTTGKFQIISSLFRKNPEIPEISDDVLETRPQMSNEEDHTFSASEFKHLNLAPFMISHLEKDLNMTKMTSVQKASLPLLIDGKDAFIKSPTGTGKTLVYVIPVVQSLQAITPKIKREDGPYCVVLVPTRELALQSLSVIQQVLKPFIWIVPGCVTGGERRKSEKARLRKGMNILVATPGRLIDHLKTTQCLKLNNLQWLILDEADRLLDMGFEQDLSFIISTINDQSSKKIQTVLLSATLAQGVEKLVDLILDNPITINMAEHDDSTALDADKIEYETPAQLKQFCVVVPMKLRLVTLAAFLKQHHEENCKIIVFLTTQDSVDFHYQLFKTTFTAEKGMKMLLMKLHGKLSQQERTKIFLDFKKLNHGVLLSTDVAARGLDLPSVNWIVQYNPPACATDYVHRVGRTARIGSSGQALLFLLPTEVGFLKVLSQHNLRLQETKMDDILHVLSTKHSKSSKGLDKELFHSAVTSQHLLFEEALNDVNNQGLKNLAQIAFRSFIGAYNTFPSSMKQIFHPRNLHLGHLAKSFAFRETPTELKQDISKRKRSQMVDNKAKNDKLFSGPFPKKYKKTTK